MQTPPTLIRLGGCPGWSESLLGARHFVGFVMRQLIFPNFTINLTFTDWDRVHIPSAIGQACQNYRRRVSMWPGEIVPLHTGHVHNIGCMVGLSCWHQVSIQGRQLGTAWKIEENNLSRSMEWFVRPAKTPNHLGHCPIGSESFLCRVLSYP